MTVKDIISQIEPLFGRKPEKYMLRLINDALKEASAKKKGYTVSATTDLETFKRWYELSDQMISIRKVEIKDTNNRYVMIPKLSDSQLLLREDTDLTDDSLT
tara:strand:+ start:1451 stop:1756 length:306 start_codon:yes stop_codon:yes gene_type:complete